MDRFLNRVIGSMFAGVLIYAWVLILLRVLVILGYTPGN